MDEKKNVSTYDKILKTRTKKQLVFIWVAIIVIVAITAGSYYFLRPFVTKYYAQTNSVKAKTRGSKFNTDVLPNHILIPRLDINEALYSNPSGTLTQDDLLKGAGYLDNETNKAGLGNCVIFGHSAVTEKHDAPFGAIGDGLLKIDDEIILTDAANTQYIYIVTEITEVASNDFSYVKPFGEDEKPAVTIITCIGPDYPDDRRLMARAVLK